MKILTGKYAAKLQFYNSNYEAILPLDVNRRNYFTIWIFCFPPPLMPGDDNIRLRIIGYGLYLLHRLNGKKHKKYSDEKRSDKGESLKLMV